MARYEAWLGKRINESDRRWRSAGYVFLPWLDALARHERILDVVEDLIGPDILVYTATFFIKEADSPTFAAWHQDATYFGLDPHEHVTAWVALSDANAAAGCMEVVSFKGAPGQMRHAALRLEHSINGGGQAITDWIDDADAVMLAWTGTGGHGVDVDVRSLPFPLPLPTANLDLPVGDDATAPERDEQCHARHHGR